MKITITGSGGFIGSHLKERLIGKGHFITGWDRKSGRDIKDFETEGADMVIHLAAYADVRASIENPDKYWTNNVEYTTRIQRMCEARDIPLIYASSSCIHAWHKSPYGISKKVNEETAGDKQTGLRFTTVYGEGARDTMMIGKLIRNEAKYATNHVRDFIHVNDVCDVIELLINKNPDSWQKAYDVGTGTGNLVSHLANDICGRDLPVNDGDPCEALDNTADISPLQREGWSGPKVNVKDFLMEEFNKLGVK